MSAFAISTWFPEKLSVAPYLALVGPPSSGKTTAMRMLSSLCYRGLLTADLSPSAFYDVSHRFRPTILLDETLTSGRPRELIHLLKTSNTPGCVSLRKDKARLGYGPKVFSWLELPNDPALNSRCIIMPMHRTSRIDLKNPKHPEVVARTKKIRMCLLQFRFERFWNVIEPKPPLNGRLSGRSLDLYRALALPFEENDKVCKFLAGSIAAQDELQAPPLSPAQESTLWVLYRVIHECNGAPSCSMSLLTKAVNQNLKDRGEPSGLNERKLGDILTSLTLTNRSRKNTGYFLSLDRAVRVRIHEAADVYHVKETCACSIDTRHICTSSCRPASVATPAPARPPVESGMATIEVSNSKGRKRRVRHEFRVGRERSVRRFGGRGSGQT